MTTFRPAGGRIEGLGSYATLTLRQREPLDEPPNDPIRVGVVDTGLVLDDDTPHYWFGRHVVFDPIADTDLIPANDPSGSRGHGTFVAGVILSEARDSVVHMKGALNTADGQAEDLAVASAIYALANAGITLVNLSFSGDAWEVGTPPVIAKAITALGPDAVVIAAAGNLGLSRPFYPGAMPSPDGGPDIVAVGALAESPKARVARFSNYGESVRLYADGENLHGPYGIADWALWSGTSFASASVTGMIADYLGKHPGTTPKNALAHIMATEDKVDVYGVNGPAKVPFVRARG